jgi:hypothetical protein
MRLEGRAGQELVEPMPIQLGGGSAVNWVVFTGQVTHDELVGLPDRIHPERPEFGTNWIGYIDADADVSGLDLPAFVQLKAKVLPRVKALAAKGQVKTALVSGSARNDEVVRFWCQYSAADPEFGATVPYFASSLPRAFEYLGLTGAARFEAEDAIREALGLHSK